MARVGLFENKTNSANYQTIAFKREKFRMTTMFIRRLRSTRQAHNSMAMLRKSEGRINNPTRIA